MEIKWLSQIENEEIDSFGAKAVKFSLLLSRDLPIPQGFALSFDFFDEFLRESKVFDFLNQKIMTVSSQKDANKLSKDIRTYIQMSAFPEEALNKILGFYHAIDVSSEAQETSADKLLNSASDPLVVLRLSCRPKDKNIDFPAIRNIKGEKEIQAALLEAFSFLFSSETIIEISKSRRLPRVALIFQRMVNSKKSGFCHFKKDKPFEIFSTFGLIDSIKKGEVYPDMFRLAYKSFNILSRQIHKKEIAYYNDLLQHKIREVSVEGDDTKDPSITYKELNELYNIAKRLNLILKTDFDFEWAFDSKGLWIINYEVKQMAEKDVFDVIFEEDDEQQISNEDSNSEAQREDDANIDASGETNPETESEENLNPQQSEQEQTYTQEHEKEQGNEASYQTQENQQEHQEVNQEPNKEQLNFDKISNAFDKVTDKYARINPSLKDILGLYKEDVLEELRKE